MKEPSFTISILIRHEQAPQVVRCTTWGPRDDLFLAHCLELDIVAVSGTIEEVKNDILSLIQAQIEYAFENNNLDNLYRPAPPEVWREYYTCRNEEEHSIRRRIHADDSTGVPQWLVAKTCESISSHHHII
jgi:hypothetical protein